MPGYRRTSEWNDENELRCLVIFKKLVEASFPRGMQIELCREMAHHTNLDVGNISAKVSNFKSVAGINNESNASANTVSIYNQ
ncbi:MAG: hypothetical protein ACRBBR_16970, partial [Cellvibrionaceae bacterium]